MRTFSIIDRVKTKLVVMVLFVLFFSIPAQSQPAIEVGKFSAETVGHVLPVGWKPLTFKKIERHTVYKKYLLNTAQLCWADENRFAKR